MGASVGCIRRNSRMSLSLSCGNVPHECAREGGVCRNSATGRVPLTRMRAAEPTLCDYGVWPAWAPSRASSITFALKAGRSAGVRLETRP